VSRGLLAIRPTLAHFAPESRALSTILGGLFNAQLGTDERGGPARAPANLVSKNSRSV
jgi:hypothetical protein